MIRRVTSQSPIVRCGILALLCIPLAFVVYWPILDDFFVSDDFFFLRAVRNHSFPTVMLRAFTFPSINRFDEVTLFWRPLIDFYFFAFKPFGLRPEPYHVVNVALHGAAGTLGVVFIYRLTRSIAVGVISGLLFTVAPTFDFAVTWIAQVSELLGAVLVLAALILWHTWLTEERAGHRYAIGTWLLTLLALLTKESTVILVVLLPTLALVMPDPRRRTVREVGIALAPAVLLCGAFGIAMGVADRVGPDPLHSIGWHMAVNLWDYLQWMIYPYRFGSVETARTLGVLCLLGIGAAALLLRQRALIFLFVWTIVALLPFTGFDGWIELRYTYLATLPFVAFLVAAIVKLISSLPRQAASVGAALLGIAVLAAVLIVPLRTRDQQSLLVHEARAYEVMVSSVRALCGAVPPGTDIFIKDPPYRDLFNIHSVSVLNLYYGGIDAHPVTELPDLIAFVEPKCVVEYDGSSGTYHRLTEF